MTLRKPFRPLPLLGNAHVQTILGNLWRGHSPELATTVRHVTVEDGDVLVAHESTPRGWRAGGPMAILVHGLGGSHRSGYMGRLAGNLHQCGWRTARLDLRGAGAGLRLARRFYNAAASHDVRAVLEAMHNHHPTSPLVLIGFSLGGNIVLKLAGESQAPPALTAVAAIAPPVDLVRCSALLAEPRNRIYDRYFARNLVAHVRRHAFYFPDLPRVRFPPSLTLRQFDDLFTAPRGGFADAMDYYQRASALPLLPKIGVPAFILAARDDPFIAVDSFADLGGNVEVEVTERGGHLGFLGWHSAGGIRWAEQRIVEWVLARELPKS